MPRKAIWKALLSIARSTIASKEFHGYEGAGFTLTRGTSIDHNNATLHYLEGTSRIDITAEHGVDGGLSMNVDEMGAQSFAYANLPLQEKLRIALNIRDALTSQAIPCQVIYDNRPL